MQQARKAKNFSHCIRCGVTTQKIGKEFSTLIIWVTDLLTCERKGQANQEIWENSCREATEMPYFD